MHLRDRRGSERDGIDARECGPPVAELGIEGGLDHVEREWRRCRVQSSEFRLSLGRDEIGARRKQLTELDVDAAHLFQCFPQRPGSLRCISVVSPPDRADSILRCDPRHSCATRYHMNPARYRLQRVAETTTAAGGLRRDEFESDHRRHGRQSSNGNEGDPDGDVVEVVPSDLLPVWHVHEDRDDAGEDAADQCGKQESEPADVACVQDPASKERERYDDEEIR